MTTDPFTDAARAEAERQFPAPLYSTAWSQSEVQIKRALWESGAEWARTHLAAQEPTRDEVEAVAEVIWARSSGKSRWGSVNAERRAVYLDMARAALSAARGVRRDEEKRDG